MVRMPFWQSRLREDAVIILNPSTGNEEQLAIDEFLRSWERHDGERIVLLDAG